MQQNHDIQWYAKELGLTSLITQKDYVMKMAAEYKWNVEQTLLNIPGQVVCTDSVTTNRNSTDFIHRDL